MDIREFLDRFTPDELFGRGVLRGNTLLLQGPSVDPLLSLMRESEVTRLETASGNWWLADNGDFSNPKSYEQVKQGHVDQLQNRGNVFNEQNTSINPHYRGYRQGQYGEEFTGGSSVESGFSLERDLQQALRANIEQLEPDIRIIDGGVERTVAAGRIDITAEDATGNLVVIELKAGRAEHESISQLLSYMGSIENPNGKLIRGILVANDFHPRTEMAAKAVPNVSLKAYSFQFTFEDR